MNETLSQAHGNRCSPPSRSSPWPPVPRARRRTTRQPAGAADAPPAPPPLPPAAVPPPAPLAAPLPPAARAGAARRADAVQRRAHAGGAPRPGRDPVRGPTVETTWFTRTPLKVSLGSGNQNWAITFFGTIQADYIADTTRSYNDSIGQRHRRAQRHLRRHGRPHAVLDAQHARRLPARFAGHRRRQPVGGVPGRLRGQPAGGRRT